MQQLPVEIAHYSIFEYLSNSDLCRTSQASHEMIDIFCRPALLKRFTAKLLSHIVRGEEERAMRMIAAKPEILRSISTTTDYAKRTYRECTPFQAALLCQDIILLEKILPYFNKLQDGQVELKKQFKNIFKNGITFGASYDFSTLTEAITNSMDCDIVSALQKMKNKTSVSQELDSFRHKFAALSTKEIFYNPAHLIQALDLYNNNFDDWSENQQSLFWCQVVGYTQRFMPVSLIQAIIQGLFYHVHDNISLNRRLNMIYDDNKSILPLYDEEGLGFDFALVVIGANPGRSCIRYKGWLDSCFRSYAQKIENFYARLNKACESSESPLPSTDKFSSPLYFR
jgi:hypothetical protein